MVCRIRSRAKWRSREHLEIKMDADAQTDAGVESVPDCRHIIYYEDNGDKILFAPLASMACGNQRNQVEYKGKSRR